MIKIFKITDWRSKLPRFMGFGAGRGYAVERDILPDPIINGSGKGCGYGSSDDRKIDELLLCVKKRNKKIRFIQDVGWYFQNNL